MVVLRALLAASSLIAAGAANAHVSLQPATAVAESYQVLRFGVGHGCDGEPTTALRIEIPAGVSVARPQPKPGWSLSIEPAPGRPDKVSVVVWSGGLPADQFDEFLILAKLPPGEGLLAFPVVQACGDRENRWVEITVPGAARPSHPAPALTLTPAPPPQAGHDHGS